MVPARWRCPLVSLVLATVLMACAPSPSEVFEGLEKTAREGKAAAFAAHFTEESRPFAEALMSLYVTHSSARGPLSRPLEVLARSEVVGERIEGRRAFLEVRTPDGAGHTLIFELEEGDWKLDIGETEKRNAENL